MHNAPTSARPILTLLAAATSVLSGTLVTAALPAIGCGLADGAAQVGWVMACYLLSAGLLLPVGGALGDRVGRGRVLVAGLAVLAASSMLYAAADTMASLLADRVGQGAGAAAVLPNAAALLGAHRHRRRLLSLYSSSCTAAVALGPTIGGLAAGCAQWRLTFVTLGALAGATAAGLAQGGGRRAGPMPNAPRRRHRIADGRATMLLSLYTAAIYGAFFDLLLNEPARLVRLDGVMPAMAGAAMLPASLVVIVAGPSLSRVAAAVRPAASLAAAACLALAGTAALANAAGPSAASILGPVLLIGIAMALAAAPLTTAVLDAAGPDGASMAAGLNSAAARLGGAVAVMSHGPAVVPASAGVSVDIVLLVVAFTASLVILRQRAAGDLNTQPQARKAFA